MPVRTREASSELCRHRHDVDNGTEFINAHLLAYCEQEQITVTRSRAGNENDGCHVEQTNWSVVRGAVGYHRYDTPPELELLARARTRATWPGCRCGTGGCYAPAQPPLWRRVRLRAPPRSPPSRPNRRKGRRLSQVNPIAGGDYRRWPASSVRAAWRQFASVQLV